MTTRPPHRPQGFTLIEILVVISIIALLIGILLPALGKARETARSSVCLGHLRSVGIGMATYAAESKGWIPGMNTSGYYLNDNSLAGDPDGPREPIQNTDWISPALGTQLSLPATRLERLQAIFEEQFKCPSNNEKYEAGSAFGPLVPPNPTQLTVVSYMTPQAFHTYGFSDPGGAGRRKFGVDSVVWGLVNLPANYAPRLDNVGIPSAKIFGMEGVRYIDKGIGKASFNSAAYQPSGGNYADYGPCVTSTSNGTPYNPAYPDLQKKFAYRHDLSFNTVFFDGHGQRLKEADSRETSYYFPAGSRIMSAGATNDPDDVNGVIR